VRAGFGKRSETIMLSGTKSDLKTHLSKAPNVLAKIHLKDYTR